LKPTAEGRAALGDVTEGFPYPGAKPHFHIDDVLDDRERLRRAFVVTAQALPLPKVKATAGSTPRAAPKSKTRKPRS
ncbi:MAG: TfoX domain-containing protein, partial [Proteobacteria bacterium]|nr:TfoX domain-containing protein [Pseudomonadota bacterium]